MKNNYLVIPRRMPQMKESSQNFLFPLKEFCVGHLFEVTLSELEMPSYILINRLLDLDAIEHLEKKLKENKEKIKGIFFEDLGVLKLVKKLNLQVELIYYPTHAMCSKFTVNSCLEFVDSVVISPDITEEEIKEIIANANKDICLYTFGPLPYLYSRRTLLTNFQKEKKLPKKQLETLTEKITNNQFLFIENDFGTVCYDKKNYDGRRLLKEEKIKYHIINLENTEYASVEEFLDNFETKTIENTFSGFLEKKTIYRLPPKGE